MWSLAFQIFASQVFLLAFCSRSNCNCNIDCHSKWQIKDLEFRGQLKINNLVTYAEPSRLNWQAKILWALNSKNEHRCQRIALCKCIKLSYICWSHGKVHSKDVFPCRFILMEFLIVISEHQLRMVQSTNSMLCSKKCLTWSFAFQIFASQASVLYFF